MTLQHCPQLLISCLFLSWGPWKGTRNIAMCVCVCVHVSVIKYYHWWKSCAGQAVTIVWLFTAPAHVSHPSPSLSHEWCFPPGSVFCRRLYRLLFLAAACYQRWHHVQGQRERVDAQLVCPTSDAWIMAKSCVPGVARSLLGAGAWGKERPVMTMVLPPLVLPV